MALLSRVACFSAHRVVHRAFCGAASRSQTKLYASLAQCPRSAYWDWSSVWPPSSTRHANQRIRFLVNDPIACNPARFIRGKGMSSNSSLASRIPRRVLLYVPGSNPRMLQKSVDLPIDAVIFDLEDSVAPAQKIVARSMVFNALQAAKAGNCRRFVRINPGGMAGDDVRVVVQSKNLDGIVIPKVNSAADVVLVDRLIDEYGLEGRKRELKIIASIESPLAVMNLTEIATSSVRLDSLLFAAEDYCASSGIVRTSSRIEMLYARSAIVTAAKAFDLEAIDLVCVNYQDTEALREESEEGRRMGFTGKQAIHPSQVEAIKTAFRPTDKEILRAVRILHQYSVACNSGKGAIGLSAEDGSSAMIDAPMLLQANATLQQARNAGMVIPIAPQD